MKFLKTFENHKKFESFFQDEKSRKKSQGLKDFLKDKKFKNPKTKQFLYHGTNVHPDSFELRDDYDGEDSNTWSGDLPPGILFLSTKIEEPSSYGKYVIPCELERYDHISFEVNTDNPSRAFDMDYGTDLYMPDEYFGFWEKFEDSAKSALVIKGYNKKWTVITYASNVIPRTDLAKEFYDK